MCGARNGMLRRMRAPADGMRLDCFELGGGQRAGFRSTSSGTPILPMSCSSAPRRSVSIASAVQLQLFAHGHREPADPFRMAGGVWIARVERGGQRAHGAEVGRFRVCFRRRQRGQQRVEGRTSADRARGPVPDSGNRFRGRARRSSLPTASSTGDRSACVSVRASQTLPRTASPIAPSPTQPARAAPLAFARRRPRRSTPAPGT